MKVITYLLALIIIFTNILNAQDKDSLIQIYPGLGDTIDQFDRNYFELFNDIEGFESAVFYIRNGEQLVSRVTYSINGFSNDTMFIQPLSVSNDLKIEFGKILRQRQKSYRTPIGVVILEKNGIRNVGQLKIFNKYYIYLNSEINSSASNEKSYKFKIPVSNIDSVFIIGKSNALPYMGFGVLIGFLFGGALGFASGDDSPGFFSMTAGQKGLLAGSIAGLIGGVFGLIVGLISSTDDLSIQINTQNDLLHLKDYAKYYFKYDKSIEEQYVEIE